MLLVTGFPHCYVGEHVEPCEGQEVYMCQWGGCKVFDVPSTSYRWYKGHVLGHTNAKMYRCLIEGCPASYRTREGRMLVAILEV